MNKRKATLLAISSSLCLTALGVSQIATTSLAATETHIDRTVTVKAGNKVFSKEATKIERYTKTGELAEGEYLVSEENGVKTVEKITISDAPMVKIENLYGDIRKGDSFDVSLSEDSEWTGTPVIFVMKDGKYLPNMPMKVQRTSYNRISVMVDSEVPRGAIVCVPVEATASGEKEFQTVSIESRNSGVSNKVVNFAKTGENDITVKMEREAKITRNGDNEVTLIFEEFQNGSFKGADSVKLTLPEGFEWDTKDKNVDINRRGREMSVNLSRFDTDRLDTAYIKAKIEVSRDAAAGDVYASISSKNLSGGDLKVASYVDSDISVTAESIEVLAGADVPGMYKAKLVIEENTEEALREGRAITIEADEDKFSLQDGQNLKVSRRRGDGVLMIDTRSSKVLTGDDREVEASKIETMRRGGAQAANLFELRVKEESKRASKYEVEIPFVVAPGYEGDIVLKINGAGIRDKEVKIATAKLPLDVEIVEKEQKAGEAPVLPDIVLKERVAGALMDLSYQDGKKTTPVYEIVSDDISFEKAEVKVTSGNIVLSKGDAVKDKKIQFGVDRKSSQKAEITISGVEGKILKDESGIKRIKMMLAGSEGRHYFGDKIKPQEIDYIKVVKEETSSQNTSANAAVKADTTTFRIGSTEMVKVKGTQTSTEVMDAVPFIQDGRTMLPVRYIAESLGAEVEYNASTRQAIFRTDTAIVSVSMDSPVMHVNGARVQLLSKPANVGGRIYLPVRSLAMAFNAEQNIIWDATTQSVTVKSLQF